MGRKSASSAAVLAAVGFYHQGQFALVTLLDADDGAAVRVEAEDDVVLDRKDLKQYFDAIFDEVESQKTLQVLILEHAYFADDERYIRAVRRRWTEAERLIPADWPKVQSGDEGTRES
jgi:hypothetical protein